jgi:hypothetical protein
VCQREGCEIIRAFTGDVTSIKRTENPENARNCYGQRTTAVIWARVAKA